MGDPDAGGVSVACVYGDELATSFWQSFNDMLLFDMGQMGLLAHRQGLISVRYGTDGIVGARNTVVRRFLDGPSEWLLWIDSDMGFAADTPYRLLQVADAAQRPMVGALCFASREYAGDGMGGFATAPRPTIFDWTVHEGRRTFISRLMYPVNAVTQCAATGSACVLIHRSVFEQVAKQPDFPDDGWYNRVQGADGRMMGEDISFCVRAGAAEVPILVHTGVRTTHMKPVWLGESHFWATGVAAPPATEEVAVIVPVMNRPQNAKPFMDSLRASTGLAKVIAVWHSDDNETAQAWLDAGADLIIPADGQSFAEKVNYAYRGPKGGNGAGYAGEPWLFITGDDVRFRAGWLDHAQHVAATFGADVVGTNDLGSVRVMTGEHATHLLVRRSYVDTMGASWDGPGVVCHEGYRHWFVDDEVVAAAKQRGTWQMALGSIVEHLHPLFGRGEDDAVYRLGQSFADEDRKVFEARCQTYL